MTLQHQSCLSTYAPVIDSVGRGLQGKNPLASTIDTSVFFSSEKPLTCYSKKQVSVSSRQTCENNGEYVALFCKNCGLWVAQHKRCKKRTCPYCQAIKNKQILFRYVDVVKKMQAPKLITLTAPWTKDLGKSVSFLKRSWWKLCQQRYFTRLIRGYICGAHFLARENGMWYVHLHIIVDSIYIPQKKLSKSWHQVSGAGSVVDIRKAWSPKGGLKYILGYITATHHLMGYEDEVNSSLKGTRILSTGGSCYNLPSHAPRLICPRCSCSVWGRMEDSYYEPQQLEWAYYEAMQRCLDEFT